MVDPPELLQFLPGPWSRAHALEAGGTVRANTAWGDPAPTALKGGWILGEPVGLPTMPDALDKVTHVEWRSGWRDHHIDTINVNNNLTTATTTTSATTATTAKDALDYKTSETSYLY